MAFREKQENFGAISMTDESRPQTGRIGHWLLLAALAAGVFIYTLLKPAARNENPSAIGSSLHHMHLEPLTGGGAPVGLVDLQGRVTVVNFWGTWCPPCLREFPHVVALQRRFRQHESFQLFAVSCGMGHDADPAELRDNTAAFLRQREVELPTYFDPDAVTRFAVHEVLGGTSFSYPTTLVFDQKGAIRGAWVGYNSGDEREVEALVEKLLAGGKI